MNKEFIPQISYVNLDIIKKYNRNNKDHSEDQIKRIAKSIKEVGFLNPIILDKNNVIIAGEGRYLASQSLNLWRVPVIFVEHLSDEQVNAYRLADNALAEFAVYDRGNIFKELEDLRLKNYDIENLGVSEEDLDKLSKEVEGALEKTKNQKHDEKTQEEAPSTQLILTITFKEEHLMRELYEEMIERGMEVKIFN